MITLIEFIINLMHALPPEVILLTLILTSYGGVLLFMRLFGINGLICFMIVALIGANIQVLKVVQFSVFADPVALGTVLFASTYLVTDIVTEYYGPAAAKRVVWLGFFGLLFHNIFMLMTLGYNPLDAGSDYANLENALQMEQALNFVIQPQPGLLIAALIAYLLSQNLDIMIFTWIKKKTDGKKLWLRNNASAFIAAFIDTTVFSVLAWVVFAVNPVPWEPLIYTYILGTFYVRVFVALLDTPFMYLSQRVHKARQKSAPVYDELNQ